MISALTNVQFVAHTVVHLGLSQHIYEVDESNGSVSVCFELMDGALTGRPIVMKAYSSDGSAIGITINCCVYSHLSSSVISL